MTVHRWASACFATTLAMLAAVDRVEAQRDSVLVRGPLMTWRDGGVLAAATAASLVLIGSDLRIADAARSSSVQRPGPLRSLLDGGNLYGDPGVMVISAGTWGIGHLAKNRTAERIGLRSLEAVMASGAVTVALKVVTGRARPDRNPGDARDFRFMRGLHEGSDYQAFPSGHATTAFAFAAAVDAEWARMSPKRPAWVRPVLYGMAVVTAASRVFDDRHWASDVVMGSAIGYVTGHAVVRWHADRR